MNGASFVASGWNFLAHAALKYTAFTRTRRRVGIHRPLREDVLDAFLGLLFDPAVDRLARLLGRVDEVDDVEACAVVDGEVVEIRLLEGGALLARDRVRDVETERLPVLALRALSSARELEIEEVERRLNTVVGEVEVKCVLHFGGGGASRARVRHRERDRDTVRRQKEILVGVLGLRAHGLVHVHGEVRLAVREGLELGRLERRVRVALLRRSHDADLADASAGRLRSRRRHRRRLVVRPRACRRRTRRRRRRTSHRRERTENEGTMCDSSWPSEGSRERATRAARRFLCDGLDAETHRDPSVVRAQIRRCFGAETSDMGSSTRIAPCAGTIARA